MKFYSSQIKVLNYDKSMETESYAKSMRDKQRRFFEKNGSDTYVFIVNNYEPIGGDFRMMIGVFTRKAVDVESCVKDFLTEVNIEAEVCNVKECGLGKALNVVLWSSVREGFLEADDEVLERFGMENIYKLRPVLVGGVRYYEGGIADAKDDLTANNKELYIVAEEAIKDKLNTVTDTSSSYLVSTDKSDTAYTVADVLINKLNEAGIISDKHYFIVDVPFTSDAEYCEDLYNIIDGRTIIVNLFDDSCVNSRNLPEKAKIIAEIADKHKEVVTVFNVPDNLPELKSVVCDNIKELSLIEIDEKPLAVDKAREYLSKRAIGRGLTVEDSLLNKANQNRIYKAEKLDKIFEAWLDKQNLSYEEAERYLTALCELEKLDDYFSLLSWLGDDEEETYKAKLLDEMFEEWKEEQEEDEYGYKLD